MNDKPTAIINRLSFALVGLLAAGAFVLSYASLWGTALAYGLSPWLAWIWPLLVDFALIVFSLSVVRANLKGERVLWPWLMVGVYTLATVSFNVLHAPDNTTARIVAIVAPVSLFLSFETLMAMLKAEVRRSGAVQSMAEIEAESRKKRAELDNLESSRLAEIEGMIAGKRTELDALTGHLETANQTLQKLGNQTEDKRRELGELDTARLVDIWALVSHVDPTHLEPDTRRILAALLKNGGVSQKDIAAWAKVDPKTIQRDIEKCNGLVRK